ncbi:MAG TPA: ABC transporter substrate-binding protein [Sphingomonadaceae bacterium]|nr:ABC transporter substrate-binding protein [Sphingomonadaceae bacterium]
MTDPRRPVVSLPAVLLVAALVLTACAPFGDGARPASPAPLAIRGSTATIEIAPVLLAARDYYPAGAEVRNGGIGNLVGAAPVASLGKTGTADIATHAETQALRYSLDHPDIRIILTVAEGYYRIVARRSAGIAAIADLRGKRIAALPATSSAYFLARMLAQAGLQTSDVEIVRITPIENMAKALAKGTVDAVAIWEPYSGNAADLLGADALELDGRGVYRELFNLNSTAARLADPTERARIVAFVRAVIAASAAIAADPRDAQALVTTTARFSPEEVARAWPHLAFPAALPADLLDVLVGEEKWLAQQDERAPRSREALARLIDASIYEEAQNPAR